MREFIALLYAAHARSDVKVANPFPETGAWFHRARRGKARARNETRRSESRSRCRSRSARKGRGGLLPIRGRPSGFPLGNARVKWRRLLRRNARARWNNRTVSVRRAPDYSFDSSKKKHVARNCGWCFSMAIVRNNRMIIRNRFPVFWYFFLNLYSSAVVLK